MPEPFEIRSEEDLFRALQMVEYGDWPTDQIPLFVDWPRYEITIRGEDFDGGIPTRMLPALNELQRTIRRAYARSVYGSPQRLTKEELRQTQLIIRLEPGSTTISSVLAKVLNVTFENMGGPVRAHTILGVAAIFTLGEVLVAEINAKTEKHEIEYQIAEDVQETRRLEIVAGLALRNIELTQLLADTSRIQGELLKRLDDTDSLSINGEEVVPRAIVTRPVDPQVALVEMGDERVVSVFRILSVDSGGVGRGFRIRVHNMETGEKFRVSVSDDALLPEELEALRQGEWAKTPLQMEIFVERRGSRIRRATLISVEPAPAGKS